MSDRVPGEPDFYVNYLPVPKRLRRFLRVLVPSLVWAMAMVAGLAAFAMRYPGSGRWATQELALEGVVLGTPWPVLRVRGADGSSATVLLVEYGKLGADRAVAAAGVDGHWARVHGTVIERGGRRVLELAPRPGAIERLDRRIHGESAATEHAGAGGLSDLYWTVRRGPMVTIEGEIVDPKCYLGAMRPGSGETHRACARVCIAGGIPAGLIWRNPREAGDHGETDGFCLLLDETGRPLGERALPWVGRPVRVTGDVEWWDDLMVLRVEPRSIVDRN